MDQAESLAQLSVEARSRMSVMTKRLAGLQAHVTRLDALGLHLTELAGLDLEEFDFTGVPALGGPSVPISSESLLKAAEQDSYGLFSKLKSSLICSTSFLPNGKSSSMFWRGYCRLNNCELNLHPRVGLSSQVGSHLRTDIELTQFLASVPGMMGWISQERKELKFSLLRAA